MIVHEWCVIDPKLDRPCFSSFAPETLERTPEVVVIRFDRVVPDPVKVDEVIEIRDEDHKKNFAASMYEAAKKKYESR